MNLVHDRIVPILVGMMAVILLDHSLGHVEDSVFERLFHKRSVRIIALFGAAYGANGGRVRQAAVALTIYFLFQSDMVDHVKAIEDFFGSSEDETTAEEEPNDEEGA